MASSITPPGGPSCVPSAANQLRVGDVIIFNDNWEYKDDYAGYYDDEYVTIIRGSYLVRAIKQDTVEFDQLYQNDKGRSSGDVVIPIKHLVNAPYYKK